VWCEVLGSKTIFSSCNKNSMTTFLYDQFMGTVHDSDVFHRSGDAVDEALTVPRAEHLDSNQTYLFTLEMYECVLLITATLDPM
jgi:hypothetical protein